MASDRASKKDCAVAGAGAAGGTLGATLGGGDSVGGMGTVEMRDAVISLLEGDETVVQALRRLGKRTERAGGLWRVKGCVRHPLRVMFNRAVDVSWKT